MQLGQLVHWLLWEPSIEWRERGKSVECGGARGERVKGAQTMSFHEKNVFTNLHGEVFAKDCKMPVGFSIAYVSVTFYIIIWICS
jgi:hypothetical protein